MTVQICTKPEQRVEFMPDIETAYERHMAIVRATLNQEVSKAGRTWMESTHRQRFNILQLDSSNEREEITKVFTLDWADLPAKFQRSYEQVLTQFVGYVVKHGWAK